MGTSAAEAQQLRSQRLQSHFRSQDSGKSSFPSVVFSSHDLALVMLVPRLKFLGWVPHSPSGFTIESQLLGFQGTLQVGSPAIAFYREH